ncbi:hypothetical protein [Blautia faecicola]|uniref:Tyr recombinase domain-containing protein n=1 Tax=Blautia faecicola TaxID=2509240 RepID=A0A4Q1RHS4_9FIRM|nr:hypothetical protein [Blautia faecicola]RXS75236.1 hypothetical protein ETP43_08410 [Blautia faecicola]
MNDVLKIAVEEYYNQKKYERENYGQCYAAFVKFFKDFEYSGLKDLFNNVITEYDIVHSCMLYCQSSKKVKGVEAVNRYLSAIDLFYSEYISKLGGICCPALERGCRNKHLITNICRNLNQELEREIYVPIDEKELACLHTIIDQLNVNNFYQYGQKVICELLLNYGFKLNVIVGLVRTNVDLENGIMTIKNRKGVYKIKLYDEILEHMNYYNYLQEYHNRTYFFTNTKGEKLDSNSVLQTVKSKFSTESQNNITATTIALNGIARLIAQGLTVSEIMRITGFEIQKIVDVSEYLIEENDINKIFCEKLFNY